MLLATWCPLVDLAASGPLLWFPALKTQGVCAQGVWACQSDAGFIVDVAAALVQVALQLQPVQDPCLSHPGSLAAEAGGLDGQCR